MAFEGLKIWFLTGSQDLYGEVILTAVRAQSSAMVSGLNAAAALPVEIVHKPTVTTPDGIRRACIEASADDSVIGVIGWMHTFSPAKMWIAGLQALTSKQSVGALIQFARKQEGLETRRAYLQRLLSNEAALVLLIDNGHYETLLSLVNDERDKTSRVALLGAFYASQSDIYVHNVVFVDNQASGPFAEGGGDRLAELGLAVEDTPDGPRWRRSG